MTAATVSRRLALAVCVLAVAAMGLSIGEPAVLGVLVFTFGLAWAMVTFQEASTVRKAVASLVSSVGLLAIVGVSRFVTDPVTGFVVGAGGVAVVLFGLVAAGNTDGSWFASIEAIFGAGAIATGVVAVVSLVGHVLFAIEVSTTGSKGLVVLVVSVTSGYVVGNSLYALVSLQFVALATILLFTVSRRTVSHWFRGDVPFSSWRAVESAPIGLSYVPNGYWVVLAVQVFVALSPEVNRLFEWVLSEFWLLGDVLRLALVSGVFHGVLLALAGFMLGVIAVDVLRRWTVRALGPEPGQRFALVFGGGLVGVVALVASVVAFDVVGVAIPRPLADFGSGFGVSLAVNLVLAFSFAGAFLALQAAGLMWFHYWPGDASRIENLATGFLFAAAVATELAGGPPLVVFAGVAASLVAWDLAATASDLSAHLGEYAETRRAEVVHATGTLVTAVAAVVIATLALYGIGPLSIPGERAAVAAVLALAGALALVVALSGEGGGEAEGGD